MVVKEKTGRKRYILFFTHGRKKHEIIRIIKNRAYLAFYSKDFAIARCRHTRKDEIIEFLSSQGFKTLKTSGTIKKLKRYINNFLQDAAR